MWNTVAVIQCLVLDVHDLLLGNELLCVSSLLHSWCDNSHLGCKSLVHLLRGILK